MAEYLIQDTTLTAIADAIRSKIKSSDIIPVPNMAELIERIEGGSSKQDDTADKVNFIDYDGTVLYSYSVQEAQELTELPPLPGHDELVCQGWNWDLESIKALNRPAIVGAMYVTDDGATRILIKVTKYDHDFDYSTNINVPMVFEQSKSYGVLVNWGDGSAEERFIGTGVINVSHYYTQEGDYTISLLPDFNCTLSTYFTGANTTFPGSIVQAVYIGKNITSIGEAAFRNCCLKSITIPNNITNIDNMAFENCYSLKSIVIPDGVTSMNYTYIFKECYSLETVSIPNSVIGSLAGFEDCYSLKNIVIPNGVTSINFTGCYSLKNIVIPDGVTSINFTDCRSLKSIVIPDGVTSIKNYAFQNCYSLESVIIPNSVTAIYDCAFYECYSLRSIVIPSGVTSIGSIFKDCRCIANIKILGDITYISMYAFQYCCGAREYDFTACTAVPTLNGTAAFYGIPSDCKIFVKSGLYDEWIAATNWSTYESNIVGVSKTEGGLI